MHNLIYKPVIVLNSSALLVTILLSANPINSSFLISTPSILDDVASTLEENASHMNTALETVKSGSITFAVRDTKIDGVDIKKDEFMGLAESKIFI
jgi:dihydroxyacetone kinase-like predicted kinase